MALQYWLVALLLVSFFPRKIEAKTSAVICSQNLERVGKAPFGKKRESVTEQREALADRIVRASCDVVAVQEVYGRTKGEALDSLNQLAELISKKTGDKFISFVGEAEFDEIRNGFLLRASFARVKQSVSPKWDTLPKLSLSGATKRQTRLPFAVELDVAETARDLILVNIHFKSKSRGFKDPTGTNFEVLRMQQAEQARDFADSLSREGSVTFILGDRNSRPGSATDSILSGALILKDFRTGCALNSELEPTCEVKRPRRYLPLFSEERDGGSTLYRGHEELIDGIYVEAASGLKPKRLGLSGEFYRGSDHKLLWLELPM